MARHDVSETQRWWVLCNRNSAPRVLDEEECLVLDNLTVDAVDSLTQLESGSMLEIGGSYYWKFTKLTELLVFVGVSEEPTTTMKKHEGKRNRFVLGQRAKAAVSRRKFDLFQASQSFIENSKKTRSRSMIMMLDPKDAMEINSVPDEANREPQR